MTVEVNMLKCNAIYMVVNHHLETIREQTDDMSRLLQLALMSLDFRLYKMVNGLWTAQTRKLILKPQQIIVLRIVLSKLDYTTLTYEALFLHNLYTRIEQKLA